MNEYFWIIYIIVHTVKIWSINSIPNSRLSELSIIRSPDYPNNLSGSIHPKVIDIYWLSFAS